MSEWLQAAGMCHAHLGTFSPHHGIFEPSTVRIQPAGARLQPLQVPVKGEGLVCLHTFCRAQHGRGSALCMFFRTLALPVFARFDTAQNLGFYECASECGPLDLGLPVLLPLRANHATLKVAQ